MIRDKYFYHNNVPTEQPVQLRYSRSANHVLDAIIILESKGGQTLAPTRCAVKLNPGYFYSKKIPLGTLPKDEASLLQQIETDNDWRFDVKTITVSPCSKDWKLRLKTPLNTIIMHFITQEQLRHWGYCLQHNACDSIKATSFNTYYSVAFFQDEKLRSKKPGICIDKITQELFCYRSRDVLDCLTGFKLNWYRSGTYHPNIVRQFDAFENDGEIIFVYELLDGDPLFSALASSNSLTEQTISSISRQILAGLAFLHDRQIVHGDLRPSAIQCSEKKDPFRRIKIVGFNYCNIEGNAMTSSVELSKIDGSLHSLFGSAAVVRKRVFFSPPEQLLCWDELPAAPAMDIWACGILIYWMLSGKLPFVGNSKDEVLAKMNKGPQFEEPSWSFISEQAKLFVLKMLSFEPTKRPEAFDLLDDAWLLENDTPSYTQIIYDFASLGEAEHEAEQQAKNWIEKLNIPMFRGV